VKKRARDWSGKKPRGMEGDASWQEGAGSRKPEFLLVAGEQKIQPREGAIRRRIVGRGISVGASVGAPIRAPIIGVVVPRAGTRRTAVVVITIIAVIVVAVIPVPAIAVMVSVPAIARIVIIIATIVVAVAMFVSLFRQGGGGSN
jgi:hypothetical protein